MAAARSPAVRRAIRRLSIELLPLSHYGSACHQLKGRDRTESERFTALRTHYGFDSFFCDPCIEGAHEKGGVEGEIGRFRRRHLVPVPKVVSPAALNELITTGELVDDGRVITGRPVTIDAAFTAEAPHLMPLPGEAFDERRPRFLILVHVPTGRPTADAMRAGVVAALLTLPPELRRSLTWD